MSSESLLAVDSIIYLRAFEYFSRTFYAKPNVSLHTPSNHSFFMLNNYVHAQKECTFLIKLVKCTFPQIKTMKKAMYLWEIGGDIKSVLIVSVFTSSNMLQMNWFKAIFISVSFGTFHNV